MNILCITPHWLWFGVPPVPLSRSYLRQLHGISAFLPAALPHGNGAVNNFGILNGTMDLDFPHAFRTSCVWYFREIVDEIGRERMLAALRQLQYGNCDISDWEGKQNTNNSNPALTGFWIESSLRISPQEQVEVLERIFGKDSPYSFNTISQLKNAMLIQESVAGGPVYGKTGMGKNLGVVADAWFIGFQERNEGNLYFCVYLGENENSSTSSKMAKEIALNILRSISV